MAMKDCYEQSASSWMNEWADNDMDAGPMTDEEQEEAEHEARREMEKADIEAAEYRNQEREDFCSSRFAGIEFDMDAPF